MGIVAGGVTQPLVCSKEALVHVLDTIGWPGVGKLVGLAAVLALPSVVLMMMFGQTRVFFVMARDGLLPRALASVHPRFKTPHVVTAVTGVVVTIAAAILPVGKLADYSNSGTLFAFMMVAIAVMVLRRRDPERKRPFRTPLVWIMPGRSPSSAASACTSRCRWSRYWYCRSGASSGWWSTSPTAAAAAMSALASSTAPNPRRSRF